MGFSTKLRSALFRHIQGFSFTELDKAGTSTLITRMTSDVNQVQSGVNLVLRLFLRSPFIVVGAMVMAFTIEVKAALIFVVTIPLLSVVVFGIMAISTPMYKKVQQGLDGVLRITRENLTGVRVIRAFAKETDEKQKFKEANQELNRLQTVAGKVTACMNPVTYVIVNFATAALIYTGAFQVNEGIITQGELVALVNYMSQILVELVKLANLIVTVTKAIACGNRIQAVLDMENSMVKNDAMKQEEKTDGYAVAFDHVSLKYAEAGEESLTDITMKIRKGETIGVIGGTGSGKTSFVHLIPRFYDATKGQVLVNGVDVKEYPLSTLRDKVGIVMQKATLFQGTIRENLKWGNEQATDEELWQALATAQAKEVVEKKEGGLDAVVEQEGKNLSGGQRQRLTIARALVKKPEILILDDSASALDFATDAALRKALKEMAGDTTVFIVSQRTSSLMHADQILVLDEGEAVGIGTHEELLRTNTIYQEIYYSQFPKEAAQ